MDDKERQYKEYLSLRQRSNGENTSHAKGDEYKSDEKYGEYFGSNVKDKDFNSTIEDTPYGASKLRKQREESERRALEREEYLRARGSASNGDAARKSQGVKSRKQIAKNSAYEKNDKADAKALKKANKQRARMAAGKKPKRFKKLKLSVAIILVGALAAVALVLLGGLGILNSMEHIDIDEDSIGIDSSVASELDGYKNIAVLGTDARAGEDDSEVRSDAIIVVSINEETNEVKMFSVYRDTFLYVGDEGYDKITHAYYYGGAQQSLYTLNKNLDLNIDDVVVINWKTVADMIDSIGGIEVEIQESEIEELNNYIPNTTKNVDGSDELIEEAGTQTLNGVQAVTYSRIRKDALTGDYRRNERMKVVFAETFKKLRSAGYMKMFTVAKNVAPEVKTDIDNREIISLMLKFKSFDMTDSTTGFPYDVGSWTGYGAAGYAWYGPPINLANNVTQLHEQFFEQEGYTPTETVQQISNEISYITGIY